MKYNLFDIRFWHYDFASSWVLFLLILIPVLIVFYVLSQRKKSFAIQSGAKYTSKQSRYGNNWLKHILFGCKMVALASLIFALAKPYSNSDHQNFIKKNYEGIDIVLSMDVSGSMLAMDFRPNRLVSAKKVATEFIDGRINDRIGLVIYEGEAYTKCPLTTDYEMVKRIFPSLYPGSMNQGTAIGTGLATAVNRLRDSKAKSKVIILLSDGANNSGEISPINASEIAKEFGIKVYAIGIGKTGTVPFPNGLGGVTQVTSELDEGTLKKIAENTGGKYFNARNEAALRSIYSEIDLLEKTEVKTTEYHSDPPTQHYGFMFISLLLVVLVFTLEAIFLKRITH